MSPRPSVPAAERGGPPGSDSRLLDHLARAANLVGGRRFREAEVEVLRALSIGPSDLRALKLLALVRFKLGRLDEARAVCREIAATLPRDVGIRLKLGLIALKLDRLDEAVHELELAARLAPDDRRPWSYLGFAYARRGERVRAAAAFRRAGQEGHAAEAEEGALAGGDLGGAAEGDDEGPAPAVTGTAGPRPRTTSDAAATLAGSGSPVLAATPVGAFAAAQLAPEVEHAASVGAIARVPITERAPVYVRQDAALACAGAVAHTAAFRHVRGRSTATPLTAGNDGGAGAPFWVLRGRGEVHVAAPAGRLVPLSLHDDTLYVREDRVLAFEGTLAWESGTLPRSGLRMLQFRGHGLVALALAGQPCAVTVAPDRPVSVTHSALLGWIGNVIALHAAGRGVDGEAVAPATGAGPFGIVCEGEGVVLMDVARGSDKEGP